MKKMMFSLPLIAVAVLTLSGCMSTNVGEYSPNLLEAHTVKNTIHKKIAVNDFSLVGQEDKNHIMCRLAGNIYLPNKMTYSQYIKSVFKNILIGADRYSDHSNQASHTLSASMQKVDFSSTSGTWQLTGMVKVDNHDPVYIANTTQFGTSWDGSSACKNVAKAFTVASQNFVNKTLSNPTIKKQLNQ